MNSKSYTVPMSEYEAEPYYDIQVAQGIDDCLIDVNGRRYLDLRSGLWNVSLGYHSELLDRIRIRFNELLASGLFYLDANSYSHAIYSEYADMLLQFVNDQIRRYVKVMYTNSGSEGTELALKLIKLASAKRKIIAFSEGYHGAFFGSMSLSGIDLNLNRRYLNLKEDVVFFPAPRTEEQLAELMSYMAENHSSIGAVICEPVVGVGGAIALGESTLNRLLEDCERWDIITVFDEVATGFYRTGERFCLSRLNVSPDILILSKSINNGLLPFGTVLLHERINRKLLFKHIDHFSTQNGNLLAVYSAYETLRFYNEFEEEIRSRAAQIEQTIERIFRQYEIPFDGRGAMYAIQINDNIKTFRIMDELKEYGILVYYYHDYANDEMTNSGVIVFPPLFVNLERLEKALHIISRKVVQCVRFGRMVHS